MPEITSVEAIRIRLRQIDEQMDDAMTLVKSLKRIKGDSDKLLAEIERHSSDSKQSLQQAKNVQSQLQQLQHDWDSLKREVYKSQAESKDTRDLILAELSTATQSLTVKLAEAEDRLKSVSTSALVDQEKLFKTVLQQVQQVWDTLQKEIQQGLLELRDTRDLVLTEVTSGITSLEGKLLEAKQHLKETNEASLANQAEILSQLEASTKASASGVEENVALVLEQAKNLSNLLSTIRKEVEDESRTLLAQIEQSLNSRFDVIEEQIATKHQDTTQELTEKATRNGELLQEQMTLFREQVESRLSEHHESVGRRINDFLGQQNNLVQNLAQQIDGFHRASQSQTTSHTQMGLELSSLQQLIAQVQASLCTRDQMERKLSDEREAIRVGVNQGLTSFRNQQNRVVQTLSQQVDSLNTLCQVQSSALADATRQISDLSSAVNAHRDAARNEVASLSREIGPLRALLTKAQSDLTAHDSLLGRMLEACKQMPYFSRYFKEI